VRDRKPVLPPATRHEPEAGGASAPVEQIAKFALSGIDAFLTLLAAILIGGGGLFLTVAWTAGPKVLLQAAEYRKFTERAEATMVESWVALTLDPSRVRSPSHWRASAKASRCAVIEYGASWGAPTRRAFCGPQIGFNESYTLAELRDIAPNVPFAWARDERGFAVAEIRLDEPTRQWLSSHEPDRFMHDKWPAKSSLDWLRVELDRPVDLAIAGWSSGAATMKVAYDPNEPASALPAGTVESRSARPFNWIAVIVGAGGGLALWFTGMSMLPWLRTFTPVGRWVIAALPLIGLPWFSDQFPTALRTLNVAFAEVVGDMFGDIDKLGAMTAAVPGDSPRGGDVRLVWRAGDGLYGDTFGRLHFTVPKTPFASPDAALAALVESVTAEVGAMDDAKRAQIFANLRRDKQNDLMAAGVVFVRAARAAVEDPGGSPQARAAAKAFLAEWLTQPVEAFDSYSLGYNERKRLQAEAAAVR